MPNVLVEGFGLIDTFFERDEMHDDLRVRGRVGPLLVEATTGCAEHRPTRGRVTVAYVLDRRLARRLRETLMRDGVCDVAHLHSRRSCCLECGIQGHCVFPHSTETARGRGTIQTPIMFPRASNGFFSRGNVLTRIV